MKRIIALLLAVAALLAMTALAACGNTVTPTVSETDVQTNTEPEADAAEREAVYGQLQVKGTQLCDEDGNPVQLHGISTHGVVYSQMRINENCFRTLRDDWCCDVIRLAMYTYEDHTGYPANKDQVLKIVERGIDACLKLGVYCIVDWHILWDGDPLQYKDDAVEFFSYISEKYGDNPLIIYEICNEPNSKFAMHDVSWEGNIRPYAVEVVEAIRENDPDNIIIIGSSTFSQDADIAAQNPVEGENLMYTMHFYAGSHGDELRAKTDAAMDAGLAIFVTEWGTTNDTGGGSLYLEESDEWIDYLDENGISWCNWSYGSSNPEASNLLSINAGFAGDWADEELSASGVYIREKLQEYAAE